MRMTVQASKPFSGSQWSEVESLSARDARRLPDQRLRGATSREMLGGTDIACTYWGECEAADGMHFLSPDLMVAELIEPETGERVRSALNGRTVVELVPEGPLKRPDHVKVALIERVHG
jgi:hypothetical protein